MAEPRDDQPMVPSILDRLLDDEPDNRYEPPKMRHQILRELKQSVRRDLENLLNTRWRCSGAPPHLEELKTSLANYGLPDFSLVSTASKDARERLRRLVESSIKQFEPRFKTVRVALIEQPDSQDRTLRFRIEGLLYAEPAPEPVVFDSELEPAKNVFEMKDPTQ